MSKAVSIGRSSYKSQGRARIDKTRIFAKISSSFEYDQAFSASYRALISHPSRAHLCRDLTTILTKQTEFKRTNRTIQTIFLQDAGSSSRLSEITERSHNPLKPREGHAFVTLTFDPPSNPVQANLTSLANLLNLVFSFFVETGRTETETMTSSGESRAFESAQAPVRGREEIAKMVTAKVDRREDESFERFRKVMKEP